MQGLKKILIVGEQSTGKTAIIRAFLEHQQQSLKEEKLAQYQNSNCMASTNADGDTQNNYLNSENNNSMNFMMSSPNLIGENNGLGIHQLSSENQIAGQTQSNTSQLTSLNASIIGPSSRKPDVCSSQQQKRHTIQQNKNTSKMSENTDFSLKILTIEGQKVRIQLWDQGANINPDTTFQPLYTRHVSGCIVVANTSNPSSIAKAALWKEQFDKITKVKDEPSIPCTLFINHDVTVPSFDILRPQDSEFQQKTPKSRKESESFQEPSFLDASPKMEQNHYQLTPARLSICQTTSLKKINSQIYPLGEQIQFPLTTPVNHNKLLEFEKLASKEKNCYFGIYHVSTSDPMTVYDSFENFISRVLEDENYAQRTFSVASNFFDQYTVKGQSVRSNTMNSVECDEHINWSDDQQVYQYHQQKNNNRQNTRCTDPYGSASNDYSFKLRPLKDRRYERNMRDGNNSCC